MDWEARPVLPLLSREWEGLFTRVYGQERYQPWAAAGVVYSV